MEIDKDIENYSGKLWNRLQKQNSLYKDITLDELEILIRDFFIEKQEPVLPHFTNQEVEDIVTENAKNKS